MLNAEEKHANILLFVYYSQDLFPPRSIWPLRRLHLGRTRARVLRPQAQGSQVNIQKTDSLHVPIKIQCFVGAHKLKISSDCICGVCGLSGITFPWFIREQLIRVLETTAFCNSLLQHWQSREEIMPLEIMVCSSKTTDINYHAGGLL
jgi:hypothetical protein